MSGVKGLSVYYPFPLSLFLSPQYFCLWVGEGLVFRLWLRWGHCSSLWMPVWILLLLRTCWPVLWSMFKKPYLYIYIYIYRLIPQKQSYPPCNNTVSPWKSAGGILREVDQMKIFWNKRLTGVRDGSGLHSILLVSAVRQIIKHDSNLWHPTVASHLRNYCVWLLFLPLKDEDLLYLDVSFYSSPSPKQIWETSNRFSSSCSISHRAGLKWRCSAVRPYISKQQDEWGSTWLWLFTTTIAGIFFSPTLPKWIKIFKVLKKFP